MARAGPGETSPSRAWAPWLPVPPLRSDIRPAVYVNWLVPAERAAALVPSPLRLQRVGARGAHAVVTVVAFRHGHFGFRFLGPLRRLAPSPAQSNWRVYAQNPATGRRGVFFLATTISNPLYTAMARLTADNVPMRRPRRSVVEAQGASVRVELAGGAPPVPDLQGSWTEAPVPSHGPWSEAFPDWRAMLDHVVPQERALAVRDGRAVRIELGLDIPLDSVRPLEGEARSAWLEPLVGAARPWAFWAPRVGLSYHAQRRDGVRDD